MHTMVKDVVTDAKRAKELSVPVGTHIATITMEADGPVEIASSKATLSARIIKSPERTDSGGVTLQVAIGVSEPTPVVAAPPPKPEDTAVKYFTDRGLSETDAKKQVEKFGVERILKQQAAEAEVKSKSLDDELASMFKSPEAT